MDHDAFIHLYEADSSVLPMHHDYSDHPDLDSSQRNRPFDFAIGKKIMFRKEMSIKFGENSPNADRHNQGHSLTRQIDSSDFKVPVK